MRSWWRCLLVAGALNLGTVDASLAQVASLQIEDPVPAELKDRVSELLRSQRPLDADGAIAATKVLDDSSWRKSGTLLLRVETDCRGDFCMVIVGRVTDRVIIPELILSAGSRILAGDEVTRIWEAFGAPLTFEGRAGSGIAAFRGPQGWIVEACATCFPPISAKRPRVEPLPSPPPQIRVETFEGFRRDLGLDR